MTNDQRETLLKSQLTTPEERARFQLVLEKAAAQAALTFTMKAFAPSKKN